MSGSHRVSQSGSHRVGRRKSGAGPGKALAAVTAGIAGVGGIGAAVFLLRPADEPAENESATRPAAQSAIEATPPLDTGRTLKLTSTEGFTYTFGAVKGGRDKTGHAFIDYLITNTSGQEVPFEPVAQLFLKRSLAGTDRCADQEGTRAGTCSPPTTQSIIGFIDSTTPPSPENGDQYMPAGASYLVRVITKQPVADAVTARDLGLYVWNVRFIRDRIARPLPLP